MLPVVVSRALARSVVGFSGSRRVVPAVLPSVLRGVGSSSVVLVGCARGVDAAVRGGLSGRCRLRVFRAATFGSGRASFARRSAALVRSVVWSGGCLFVFPASRCPAGLVPSAVARACFAGFGSGSWASAALAAGLGGRVCLWLPPVFSVPASWGFRPVGGGWWFFGF